MYRGLFVFCVCGDAHVERVELALRFLKRFSRAEVVVVLSRSTYPLRHDQILNVTVPAELSNHQASIYLKTLLPQLVGDGTVSCYLDSDQIATSPRVDEIFDLYEPPVTFAPDHATIDQFSRYAVRCPCSSGTCLHLREAIRERFGIDIRNGDQRHWNGGLYLFDRRSREFAKAWHSNTMLIFDDPYWRVRDQGTLIVTQRQLGLEQHAMLPPTATRIVDRFYGYGESLRPSLKPADFFVDRSYRLGSADQPAFLHFINDGLGCTGWANWDEIEVCVNA